MAEPIFTPAAVATLAASAAAVPVLTLLGYPLGIRPEVLFAGFAGGCFGVAFLNTVPALPHPEFPIWVSAIWTASRRIVAVMSSSLAAGYIAPSIAATAAPEQLFLAAFVVGAGAQGIVTAALVKMGVQKIEKIETIEKGKPQ